MIWLHLTEAYVIGVYFEKVDNEIHLKIALGKNEENDLGALE